MDFCRFSLRLLLLTAVLCGTTAPAQAAAPEPAVRNGADRPTVTTNQETAREVPTLVALVKDLTPDQLRQACSAFARKVSLDRQTTDDLLALADGSVEDFVRGLPGVLARRSAARVDSEPRLVSGTPSQGFCVTWTDWGCVCAFDWGLGVEVGADFWPAAFQCFLYGFFTGQPSFLVVHHHSGGC